MNLSQTIELNNTEGAQSAEIDLASGTPNFAKEFGTTPAFMLNLQDAIATARAILAVEAELNEFFAEQEEDEKFFALFRKHEDALDAKFDSVSAEWGHD